MKKSIGFQTVLLSYIRGFFSRYFSLRFQWRSMWKKASLVELGNFAVSKPNGHFLSLYFFNIWSFFKSLFCMKQIQGSVSVKINENVHAWSEFLFVSLLLIFNFFPQINHLLLFQVSRWFSRCGKSLRSLERYQVEQW